MAGQLGRAKPIASFGRKEKRARGARVPYPLQRHIPMSYGSPLIPPSPRFHHLQDTTLGTKSLTLGPLGNTLHPNSSKHLRDDPDRKCKWETRIHLIRVRSENLFYSPHKSVYITRVLGKSPIFRDSKCQV
jgi:hypothetical protein